MYSLARGVGRQVVQQQSADTASRVVRVHRDLLDVKVAVNAVGDQVGHRGVGVAGYDPRQPGLVVAGEFIERERFILGDLRHANVSEALPRGPFDVLEDGQFVQAHGSNVHGRILHSAPDGATE
jgi:hypothetical protein